MPTEKPPSDRYDEFVRLYTAHARRLYGFLFAILPHEADADDVFQETSRVLWEKFADFQSGTDFFAWACRVARFQALAFRQRQARSRVKFSDEFVAAVADQMIDDSPLADAQHQALAHCFSELKPRDQEMLRLRYQEGSSVRDVAAKLGRKVDAIYKALSRLHDALLDCVTRKLRQEGLI